MKTYQTLFIGVTALCLFAVCAVPASAAVPKKAVTKLASKVKDYVVKTGNSIGETIWRNKGSVAIGTVAVAAANNPAPFVDGAVTIVTGRPAKTSGPSDTANHSFIVGWLFYAIATLLAIIGVRCLWNYVKDYKNWLPLMVVGVLLCSVGVVEAGVVCLPTLDGIASVIPKPPVPPAPVPWWNVLYFVLFVIMIFT
jgi:hypothetical protein